MDRLKCVENYTKNFMKRKKKRMKKQKLKKEIEKILKKQPNKTLDPDIIADKLKISVFDVLDAGKDLEKEGHLQIG